MRSASALRFSNGCSSLNLDRILAVFVCGVVLDVFVTAAYEIVTKMKCCVVGCSRKVGGSSQAAEDGRGAPWMAGRQFGSGSSHELNYGLCQQLRDSENASRLAQIASGDDSCDGVNEVSKRD